MAHLKVLTPVESRLRDLLDPLPTEEEVELSIEDPTEKLERLVLRRKVEEVVLRQAADKNLVFPPYLFDQAADQVLSVAKDEPCGLRGCVLIVVYVDPELGEQLLTKVKCDEAMPTTHLLVLRFHPDQTSWYTKMARIFRSLGKRKTVVSPKFELILDDFVSDVLKMAVPRR